MFHTVICCSDFCMYPVATVTTKSSVSSTSTPISTPSSISWISSQDQDAYDAIPNSAWTDLLLFKVMNDKNKCIVCHGMYPLIYTLRSCGHVVCPTCIGKLKKHECPECTCAFPSMDKEKIVCDIRESRKI